MTTKMKVIGFLMVVLLFGLPLGGYWFFKNFAILYDPHGIVTDAKLTSTTGDKAMTSLPWIGYVAYVDRYAHFKIKCNDGTDAFGGIVSKGRAHDHQVNEDCRVLQSGEEARKDDFWESR